MDFQFEETTIVYIDHSWIQRQFRLLQCSLPIFSDPLLYEESFTLYILLRTILILHLLIIQAFT